MSGFNGILLAILAVAIWVIVQRTIDSNNPCSNFSNGHCSHVYNDA